MLRCRPTGRELDPALGQVLPTNLSCPGGFSALIQREQFIKRDIKPMDKYAVFVIIGKVVF